ncbi:hypothetical protein GC167_03170, partial [bacterium]|nr:hypothetical protein [bacterium]
IPNPESRIPNPESRIPNPESRIPNPESRIPNPESRIPNPESRIPNSVDSSRFSVTRIPISELFRTNSELQNLDYELSTPNCSLGSVS